MHPKSDQAQPFLGCVMTESPIAEVARWKVVWLMVMCTEKRNAEDG